MNESIPFVIVGAMETVGSRIRFIRKGYRLTQEQFAARVEEWLRANPEGDRPDSLTRGAVGNWERNEPISNRNMRAIAITFGVPYEWITTGRGPAPTFDGGVAHVSDEAASEDMAETPPQMAVSANGNHGVPKGMIPQVDVRIGMGLEAPAVEIVTPDGAMGHPVLALWQFPPDFVRSLTRSPLNRLQLVECIGDSMEPRVINGDIALIDTAQQIPSPPGIFALWDGYGLTLKRLEIVPNSDPPVVRLIPANRDGGYQPYERELSEVNIIGRMVARVTKQ